jgi:hypothetical protein
MCNKKYEELIERLKSAEKNDIKDIEILEKEVGTLYPDKTDIYMEIANYYFRSSDIDRSILNFLKYKKNGGNKIGALLLLAKLYVEKKEYEKSENLLKELMVDDDIYIKTKKEADEIVAFYKDHSDNFFYEYIFKQKRLKESKQLKTNK